MDRVRFGRVLGRGARLAARTAYEALDAATSPAPGRTATGAVTQSQPNSQPRPVGQAAPRSAPEILRPSRAPDRTAADRTAPEPLSRDRSRGPGRPAVERTIRTRRAVQQGSTGGARELAARGFAALEPVKRASKAVSLQVSGSFFTLFALAFGGGAFRLTEGIHGGGLPLYRFTACTLVAAVFFYFAITNFVRASRL